MTYPLTRADKGSALTAADHDANLRSGGGFPTVAALLTSNMTFPLGSRVWAQGFEYEVVAPHDTAPDLLATAGGVKLRVQPDASGWYNFLAFGAPADHPGGHTLIPALDSFPAWQRAYNRETGPNGIALVFPPLITFWFSQTLHIKRSMKLRGGAAPQRRGGGLRFPPNVTGIVVHDNFSFLGNRIHPVGGNQSQLLADPHFYWTWATTGQHLVRAQNTNRTWRVLTTSTGGNGATAGGVRYEDLGTSYTLPEIRNVWNYVPSTKARVLIDGRGPDDDDILATLPEFTGTGARDLYFVPAEADFLNSTITRSSREAGDFMIVENISLFYRILPENASSWDQVTAGGIKLAVWDDPTLTPNTQGAEGTVIEGLRISAADGGTRISTEADDNVTVLKGHGIFVRRVCHIKECQIDNFKGDGIYIKAAVEWGTSGRGNANMWRLTDVLCSNNARHGFHVRGPDANAGAAIMCDAQSNGGYGIWDRSFLGNCWIGIHTQANGSKNGVNSSIGGSWVRKAGTSQVYQAHPDATLEQLRTVEPGSAGSSGVWVRERSDRTHQFMPEWQVGQALGYYTHGGAILSTGAVNLSTFINTYTESDQAAPIFLGGSMVLGGTMTPVSAGMGGFASGQEGGRLTASRLTARARAMGTGMASAHQVMMMSDNNGSFIDIEHPNFGNQAYRFRRDDWGNVLAIGYHTAQTLRITGTNSTFAYGTGTPQAGVVHVRRLAIGNDPNFTRRMDSGSAAPTSGAWARGDIVWNVNPDAGGFAGWICIAAGTPGTWRTFGAISS